MIYGGQNPPKFFWFPPLTRAHCLRHCVRTLLLPIGARMKQSSATQHRCISFDRVGFSVAEVGVLLGICDQSVYNLINGGKLKSYKVGRRRIIPADEVNRLQREAA